MSDRKKATPQVWKSHHENDGLTKYGGRDLLGYGEKTPIPKWPGYGKVALNFVINYEEGGERCLLHGDKESEKLLSEIVGAAALGMFSDEIAVTEYWFYETCIILLHPDYAHFCVPLTVFVFKEDKRHYNMESLYDYGSRAGFWRLHRLFLRKKIPATVFAVGMALERNPAICHALKEAPGWEIASHGYRWIDYQDVDEETEREHIRRTVEIHKRLIGKRPTGFYQGKVSFYH
jgi:peptidoglycan/xylan/chitin deacetylase (PgdA/CDA1 family)